MPARLHMLRDSEPAVDEVMVPGAERLPIATLPCRMGRAKASVARPMCRDCWASAADEAGEFAGLSGCDAVKPIPLRLAAIH